MQRPVVLIALCGLLWLSTATATKKWSWNRSTRYVPPVRPTPASCPAECKGAPGIPGIPGPAGPKGSAGPRGRDGIPGRDGLKGTHGRPGQDGLVGVKGAPGFPGIPGEPGIVGPTGLPGYDGRPGAKGNKGDAGSVGPSGDCSSQCPDPTKKKVVTFSGSIKAVKQQKKYYTICPTTVTVNKGGAFDESTGRFTTTVAGIYFFSCVSIADGSGATPCELHHNNKLVFTTARDEDATGPYPLGTNQVLLNLKRNDIIEFKVTPKKGGFFGSILNTFKSPSDITINGFLIYEA